MSFENPERFKVLLKDDYLVAWRENIASIAKLCEKQNINLYTINYPGLPTLLDSKIDRDLYIKESRLSENYAVYQSISKYRITKFLDAISPFIPNVNLEKPFEKFTGKKRMELFIDEIHLTEKGNGFFAKFLAEELSQRSDFVAKYNLATKNVLIERLDFSQFSESSSFYLIPRYIQDIISLKIASLAAKRRRDSKSIPADRYTTY